jgi:FAD/FMN-containing dehydrogenase
MTNKQEDINELEAIAGEVIRPEDAAYEGARQGWNLSVQQHPALIIRPANTHDVSAAVRYAATQGLAVAVQATGHGISRPADGALLIRTEGLGPV